MKVAFILAVVLVSLNGCLSQSLWPSNLIPLPSVGSPTQYLQVFKAVSSIHSALSKTPLKPFLPTPTQMATNAFQAFRAASDFQSGVEKAMAQVNTAIADAVKQANLPMESMNQFSSQVGNSFNQMLQSPGPN